MITEYNIKEDEKLPSNMEANISKTKESHREHP